MTDLAASGVRKQVTGGAPPSPPAQRLTRRRWRDSRLLVGVLLVLISVVLGARLFATVDRTQQWVAARQNLPAGHVVTRADLIQVDARLTGAVASHYYPGRRAGDLVGGTLAQPVARGDLLSDGVFASKGSVTATRVVPLIVKAGRAPSLTAGDHVDVFVFQRGSGTNANGAQAGGAETLVLHNAEFLGEDDLSNGDRSLSLRVKVADAINVVAASQSERVDIVRLEGGPGAPSAAGPTTAPGYGS